ncbi:ROK family protein [Sphingomonas aerolata]
MFEEHIGHPVWIENDANAAALAEYYVGGLMRRCSTAVVILLGHGIGAGIIVEGRILRGAMASAGRSAASTSTSAPRPRRSTCCRHCARRAARSNRWWISTG